MPFHMIVLPLLGDECDGFAPFLGDEVFRSALVTFMHAIATNSAHRVLCFVACHAARGNMDAVHAHPLVSPLFTVRPASHSARICRQLIPYVPGITLSSKNARAYEFRADDTFYPRIMQNGVVADYATELGKATFEQDVCVATYNIRPARGLAKGPDGSV